MDGPTLFDGYTGGMARRTDPATSHEAARAHVASGATVKQRTAVLAAVRAAPGLTSDELAAEMGVSRYLTARRCPELERLGLIQRGPARLSRIGRRIGITWFPMPKES